MPGREALVLSVAIPAKDELPLDPVSDLVGHYSGPIASGTRQSLSSQGNSPGAAASSPPTRNFTLSP
jgi:hypothetical protein